MQGMETKINVKEKKKLSTKINLTIYIFQKFNIKKNVKILRKI